MTTNDDIIEGKGGASSASDRAPRSMVRARPRKAKRVRSLLSAVLRRPSLQGRTTMICQSCEMTGGPFAPGEAALLLAVHEQLHHGGVSLHLRPPLPPAP
jgi:hypothetical protein